MKIPSVIGDRFLRILLPCALVWLCSGAAADAEVARDGQVSRSDAYRLLRRGDELRERREWAEAVYVYHSALDKYHALAGIAPAWEQDYYRFRIGHCERELAMIVRTTGRSVDDWLAERPGAVPLEADGYRERYYSLQEENRYLRNRLDELLGELELYREMEDIEEERERQRGPRPDAEEMEPRAEEPERRQPEASVAPVPEPPVERPAPRRQERPLPHRPVPLR